MPRPEDIHVGKRIRHRRWLQDMTQQELAAKAGVKFQQIQKYETGANRVSASRLVDLARALDVTPAFFFEGLAEGSPATEPASREEADLLRLYRSSRPEARVSLLAIAQETARARA
ncbi:helix-turn-helix domain-containing protein [Roseobacteraceae bacterium NS-SX3]